MHQFITHTLSKKRQYAYGTAAIVLVSALCFGLSGFIGYRVVAFILLLCVSLLATIFDILPVLLAATLSALIWNFFFIPPRFTLHVGGTEDRILLLMYFVIALINGALTYKIRHVEQIARLREERANSVKLYNTILNSLSHELRTPIAAIMGAADNLQFNDQLSEDNKDELVTEISKASLRLNQQVENLLNISRLESGHIQPKKEWCDVVEIVYNVVQRVEENNRNRPIHISVNPNIPLCYLDKGMFDQVIYNLLNNAAIHTAPDCSISISAACHADLLEVVIEDNGSGFRNVATKDVFEKFSRSGERSAAGSGLGLSIVKGFTDALGGSVMLQNIKSGGARFTVALPVKNSTF